MIKNQNFGIEIEMTGLTRNAASKVVANMVNGTIEHVGGGYDKYTITDSHGRNWNVVYDSSIRGQRGNELNDSKLYKVELVSPVLQYSDIELLQEIIRSLRKAGAKVNSSCGIHIHVDAKNHNPKSLRNLVNIMASKEDMIFNALKINTSREMRWAKKVKTSFLDQLNKIKPKTMEQLANIWYEGSPGNCLYHYHDSRYSALNLHNIWYKGTSVEFRLFDSSLHAGVVKSYIQFALAMSAQAIEQKSASAKKTQSTNQKYTFRTWLLRLGLIGEEFATARHHLLKNLEGDIAFRNGRPDAA